MDWPAKGVVLAVTDTSSHLDPEIIEPTPDGEAIETCSEHLVFVLLRG